MTGKLFFSRGKAVGHEISTGKNLMVRLMKRTFTAESTMYRKYGIRRQHRARCVFQIRSAEMNRIVNR
jgi:hypothetical protein